MVVLVVAAVAAVAMAVAVAAAAQRRSSLRRELGAITHMLEEALKALLHTLRHMLCCRRGACKSGRVGR